MGSGLCGCRSLTRDALNWRSRLHRLQLALATLLQTAVQAYRLKVAGRMRVPARHPSPSAPTQCNLVFPAPRLVYRSLRLGGPLLQALPPQISGLTRLTALFLESRRRVPAEMLCNRLLPLALGELVRRGTSVSITRLQLCGSAQAAAGRA